MSEIRANTISDAAGTGPATLTGQYAAKAWVNFTGIGTVTIRESGNVSSITDNGTGNYDVNFTVSMVDTAYSFSSGLTNDNHSQGWALCENARFTTAINVYGLARAGGSTLYDSGACFALITR